MEHESQHEEPPTPEQAAEVPRIWAGSLVDYNNGILHGDWIDVAGDEAEVTQQVQAMLAASPTARATGEPAEEWGIFDYENFGALPVHEYTPLATVAEWAAAIRQYGKPYAAWVALDHARRSPAEFQEAYLGDYDSTEAYADSLVADLGVEQELDEALPDWLRPYVSVDIAGLARDLQLSGEIAAVAHEGGVWLFRGW